MALYPGAPYEYSAPRPITWDTAELRLRRGRRTVGSR